jgi:hypothetical protein
MYKWYNGEKRIMKSKWRKMKRSENGVWRQSGGNINGNVMAAVSVAASKTSASKIKNSENEKVMA